MAADREPLKQQLVRIISKLVQIKSGVDVTIAAAATLLQDETLAIKSRLDDL